MNNFAVVTTINSPTKAIEVLYEKFGKNLIVIGDNKTPDNWEYKDCTFIPIEEQDRLGYLINYYVPENSYARKNLGYLLAMKMGAELIYSVDDDNCPNENWGIRHHRTIEATMAYKGDKWFNVYYYMYENHLWPRGFSLKNLNSNFQLDEDEMVHSSIQQGIADGEPDIDAIHRLVFDKPKKSL